MDGGNLCKAEHPRSHLVPSKAQSPAADPSHSVFPGDLAGWEPLQQVLIQVVPTSESGPRTETN